MKTSQKFATSTATNKFQSRDEILCTPSNTWNVFETPLKEVFHIFGMLHIYTPLIVRVSREC
jgi:hypothetical protein